MQKETPQPLTQHVEARVRGSHLSIQYKICKLFQRIILHILYYIKPFFLSKTKYPKNKTRILKAYFHIKKFHLSNESTHKIFLLVRQSLNKLHYCTTIYRLNQIFTINLVLSQSTFFFWTPELLASFERVSKDFLLFTQTMNSKTILIHLFRNLRPRKSAEYLDLPFERATHTKQNAILLITKRTINKDLTSVRMKWASCVYVFICGFVRH